MSSCCILFFFSFTLGQQLPATQADLVAQKPTWNEGEICSGPGECSHSRAEQGAAHVGGEVEEGAGVCSLVLLELNLSGWCSGLSPIGRAWKATNSIQEGGVVLSWQKELVHSDWGPRVGGGMVGTFSLAHQHTHIDVHTHTHTHTYTYTHTPDMF